MRNKQQQTKSNIYTKMTSPSYHTRPSVRLEKPICFDFPIDDLKYSTGPRMKLQEKFHLIRSIPQKQKELVYDPFNPPKTSRLPTLNSAKSEPTIGINFISNSGRNQNRAYGDHKNDNTNLDNDNYQKEICEPQSRPTNTCRSRRLSKFQQNTKVLSQITIHSIQNIGIGTGSEASLGVSKTSTNNDDNDHPIKSNSNFNDIITNGVVFSQLNSHSMIFSGDFECGNLGYVYKIGRNEYEINMLPDPSRNYSAHWYFFRVENIPPGTYTFTIAGIFRNLNLHDIGVLPVALSMNSIKNYNEHPNMTINSKFSTSNLDVPGWQRFGHNLNFYCLKKSPSPRYSFTFSFSVSSPEPDTIYFAYLYPYTYSQLKNFLLNKLPPQIVPSVLCQTPGGIDFPAIFWDADLQKCVDVSTILSTNNANSKYILNYNSNKTRHYASSKSTVRSSASSSSTKSSVQQSQKPSVKRAEDAQKFQNLLKSVNGNKKPLIVFTARHHPGETCASYAMEGFMESLFCFIQGNLCNDGNDKIIRDDETFYNTAKRLLKSFSFLIFPMMNIDGVVSGYFRHSLNGYDMNRSWIRPSPKTYPVEATVVRLIDKLVQTRPLLFFLDFHGHSSQCNAFTYGVWNDNVLLNEYEGIFPHLMSQITDLFDDDNSISLAKDAYSQTMRVALHHRYKIPFAYTLEMSYGGMDMGSRRGTQFTQGGYREIGASAVKALAEMLFDQAPIERISRNYMPPVKNPF